MLVVGCSNRSQSGSIRVPESVGVIIKCDGVCRWDYTGIHSCYCCSDIVFVLGQIQNSLTLAERAACGKEIHMPQQLFDLHVLLSLMLHLTGRADLTRGQVAKPAAWRLAPASA